MRDLPFETRVERAAWVAGTAHMDSYLQAWHNQQDGKIWQFVGNYVDKLVVTDGIGWQIADTYLERITEETR